MMAQAYPRQIINLRGRDIARAFGIILSSRVGNEADAREFARLFSEMANVPETIPVSSARFGLALALEELGLKPGDEIVLSTYTFHAMPNVIAAMKLKPVFVDIRETDFNMEPDCVSQVLTKRSKAILATHIYGQPAEMKNLREVADDKGLFLIEDCAEATGAKYRRKPVGSIGDVGLFSFSMGKPLTGFGGGALTTSDRELADSLRRRIVSLPEQGKGAVVKSLLSYSHMLLSSHPRTFRYTTYPLLSLSSRMKSDVVDAALSGTRKREVRLKGIPDDMQRQFPSATAPVLLERLNMLDTMNQKRIEVAMVYDEIFAGSDRIRTAELSSKNVNIYNAYGIRVAGTDLRMLQRRLLKSGIDSKRRHMYVCSEMEMFREFKRDCPVAERIASELLHLPINHYMNEEDARYVAEAVLSAVKRC